MISFQQAVGNQPGSVKIPVIKPDVEFNRGALHIQGHDDGEETPMIKIDQLGLRGSSLIKIDVEGMEADVLTGAQRTIRTFHPILFVENSNAEKSPEVISILYDFGYKCWWHISDYYNPHNYFQNRENIFPNVHPESNLICFHKSSNVTMSGFIECEGIDDNCSKAIDRMHR